MFTFSAINLWCTKNLVDSQYLIWKLLSYQTSNTKNNIYYISDPYDEKVEYVFLNTCWFLSTWRMEMMDVLKKLLNTWKKVYILWCAVQYFKLNNKNEQYENELKEFETFLLKNKWKVFLLSWDDMDHISVDKLTKWYMSKEFNDFNFPSSVRAYTNAYYGYEYLKIAEWCNNSCSFCIIPKIRWKQKSLKMEEILEKVEDMVKNNIKEIIIISQDTTRYWIDLYWKPMLFELLEKIDKIEWDFVYRVLYLYPDVVTLKHLEKLKKLKKFLPYFDIPLQHISSNILKKMWRFYDTEYIYKFLDYIRWNFENAFVRTNIIVWFPGETDEDFQQLLDFIKKDYFDNIALFQYHDEPLAASSKLSWKVDDETLNKRFNIISKLVDDVLENKNEKRRQKEQFGYIDFVWEKFIKVRPYLHCPEIDEEDEVGIKNILWVYNEDGTLNIWDMVKYKI